MATTDQLLQQASAAIKAAVGDTFRGNVRIDLAPGRARPKVTVTRVLLSPVESEAAGGRRPLMESRQL